jgi:hypothetical protein
VGCPYRRAGRSPHEIARAGPLTRSIKMPPMRGSGTEIAVAVGSRDRTDLRDYVARIWATGALVGPNRRTYARRPHGTLEQRYQISVEPRNASPGWPSPSGTLTAPAAERIRPSPAGPGRRSLRTSSERTVERRAYACSPGCSRSLSSPPHHCCRSSIPRDWEPVGSRRGDCPVRVAMTRPRSRSTTCIRRPGLVRT